MPLPNDLLTNEVKDRAGVEVEFNYFSRDLREMIYTRKGVAPSLECFLKVKHQDVGTGSATVQRSLVRVDGAFVGKSGKLCVASVYKNAVIPKGELDDLNFILDLNAMLNSFCALTGAGTTLLFDGSGTGDYALTHGTC